MISGSAASEHLAIRKVQKATGNRLRSPPIRKILCSSSNDSMTMPAAEEQQRLEEGVRHEMEDGGGPCAHTQRQKHVADLADRGIREDALDIVLRQRAEAGHQQRGGADHRDRELGRRRKGNSTCVRAIR